MKHSKQSTVVADVAGTLLTEERLAELESRWSELPEDAYSEILPNGWSIVARRKTGWLTSLAVGEKIVLSTEQLIAFAQGDGKRKLVERVLAILEHIRHPRSAVS